MKYTLLNQETGEERELPEERLKAMVTDVIAKLRRENDEAIARLRRMVCEMATEPYGKGG